MPPRSMEAFVCRGDTRACRPTISFAVLKGIRGRPKGRPFSIIIRDARDVLATGSTSCRTGSSDCGRWPRSAVGAVCQSRSGALRRSTNLNVRTAIDGRPRPEHCFIVGVGVVAARTIAVVRQMGWHGCMPLRRHTAGDAWLIAMTAYLRNTPLSVQKVTDGRRQVAEYCGEAGAGSAQTRMSVTSSDIRTDWRCSRLKRWPMAVNVWMSCIWERIILIGFVAVKATSGR